MVPEPTPPPVTLTLTTWGPWAERWWLLIRHHRDYLVKLRRDVERGRTYLLKVERDGLECGALAVRRKGGQLEVVGLAGHLGQGGLVQVTAHLARIARLNACSRIWFRTWRPGLRRKMARLGYEPINELEMVKHVRNPEPG